MVWVRSSPALMASRIFFGLLTAAPQLPDVAAAPPSPTQTPFMVDLEVEAELAEISNRVDQTALSQLQRCFPDMLECVLSSLLESIGDDPLSVAEYLEDKVRRATPTDRHLC